MEVALQLPFNPAQVELIRLFAEGISDEHLAQLRKILIDFRFKLLEENALKSAQQKGYSMQQINSASQEHRRKPARQKRLDANR